MTTRTSGILHYIYVTTLGLKSCHVVFSCHSKPSITFCGLVSWHETNCTCTDSILSRQLPRRVGLSILQSFVLCILCEEYDSLPWKLPTVPFWIWSNNNSQTPANNMKDPTTTHSPFSSSSSSSPIVDHVPRTHWHGSNLLSSLHSESNP